jgi:hypothetical protein
MCLLSYEFILFIGCLRLFFEHHNVTMFNNFYVLRDCQIRLFNDKRLAGLEGQVPLFVNLIFNHDMLQKVEILLLITHLYSLV